MATNPLQKYFRQPKVFIRLPSGGIYSKPGTIQGDVSHMPVFGMTGMDEIVLKTPDALLTGESTAHVIGSCCPNIKEPWEISVIDVMLILSAIRISTFGPTMSVSHKCDQCESENEYDLDLNKIIEHYMSCHFENTVVDGEIKIKIQPLTYRQSTEIGLKNFKLQQRLAQIDLIENSEERQAQLIPLFKELGQVQNEIYKYMVDSIDVGTQVVTDKAFIYEWLENCDAEVFERIKSLTQQNNDAWAIPKFPVKCDNCGAETNLTVQLDESNFFVKA
jgi:hypothetical protein